MSSKWVPLRSSISDVLSCPNKKTKERSSFIKNRNIVFRSFITRNETKNIVEKKKMDTQQSWRVRLSFKNATIFMTLLNTVTALFLIQGFLSSPSTRNSKLSPDHSNSVKPSYIKESEDMRLAMQPWKLIKRVKEIEQDGHAEPETVQQKDTKQTAAAAVDLSKRLQDFRSLNNASTLKALEEWRKRKMERARQWASEKNGTVTSEA